MYKHITSYKLVALNCIRWIYQFKKVHDIHIFIRYRTVMLLRSFVSFQKFCVCCTLAACLLLVFIIFLYPRVYSNMWFVVFFFLKSIQLAFSEQSFLMQTKYNRPYYRSVQYHDEFVTPCVRSSRSSSIWIRL